MNIPDSDGHAHIVKASLAVELNHEFSTVKLSRAVVCACAVIKQCGTNGVLRVTSRCVCWYWASTYSQAASILLFCSCLVMWLFPRNNHINNMVVCICETPCVLINIYLCP